MSAPARRGRFWAYLLQCGDGTYYAGSTRDLAARLKLHAAGRGAKYVRGRGPLRIVYAKAYRYYKHALNAERRLKTRTRRQKERLIRQSAGGRAPEDRRESGNRSVVDNRTGGASA